MHIDIFFMEEASQFLDSLPEKAKKKVVYNINRISNGEKDSELFSKLGNTDIWEFRTLFNGIKYRLFAFWDTEQNAVIIATHGIIKKTQKTPKKEIEKAEELRKDYFDTPD